MKIILFILTIFMTNLVFTQKHDFDCNNLTKAKLFNKYQEYKKYGLEIKSKDKDFIVLALDEASTKLIRQLCINAWSEVIQNGTKYTYGKYKRRNGKIEYNLYLKEIRYLETLSLFKYHLIQNIKKKN